MEKQELIDRYIYAVTRHLPQKQAADIEAELRGLIEDMLEARCGVRPPEEKDVRVILTELGTSQEIVNPVLTAHLEEAFAGERMLLLFSQAGKCFLLVFALAIFLEVGVVWFRAIKFRR